MIEGEYSERDNITGPFSDEISHPLPIARYKDPPPGPGDDADNETAGPDSEAQASSAAIQADVDAIQTQIDAFVDAGDDEGLADFTASFLD
jgi:hypothetical protein